MRRSALTSSGPCRGTAWNACVAGGGSSGASGSTGSGGSHSGGSKDRPMTWALSITTRRDEPMLPDRRVPTHPGVILATEFLGPLGMTQVQLAKKLKIPVQRVNELVRGKRGVTAETAWLLGEEFRTGPEFWMNLQSAHDLVRVRLARGRCHGRRACVRRRRDRRLWPRRRGFAGLCGLPPQGARPRRARQACREASRPGVIFAALWTARQAGQLRPPSRGAGRRSWRRPKRGRR